MEKNGFKILGDRNVAICPVMVRDEKKTIELTKSLNEDGIFVVEVTFPVVAKGTARIRNQISSILDESDIQKVIESYKKEGKRLGLI